MFKSIESFRESFGKLKVRRHFFAAFMIISLTAMASNPNFIGAVQEDFQPVTLCHQTGNGSYNEITVSNQGALNGHMGHSGDIIPKPEGGCSSSEQVIGIPILNSNLSITKISDSAVYSVGDTVTYTLTVHNAGPDDATGVVVSDTFPSTLTFVSAVPPADYDNNTGIWTVGSLANGASAVLTITATVNASTEGTEILNSASVTSNSSDDLLSDNLAAANISINKAPDICPSGPAFAAKVEAVAQGTLADDSPITDPSRMDTSKMLGAPDSMFFSLGKGGSTVLSFAHYVINVPGNDLSFHEITNGRDTYPEEKADIEVSQDGSTWKPIGTVSGLAANGDAFLDFDSTGYGWIKYLKISDATDFSLHSSNADGYDVDSSDSTYEDCVGVSISKSGMYDSGTGKITYTISWSAVGEGTVKNVTITDPVPTDVTYIPGSADNGGVYDGGTKTVTWTLGDKVAPTAGVVSFMANVNAAGSVNMWAKTVVSFSQGLKADLIAPVDISRSDPAKALGPAESVGALYDNPLSDFTGKFVSTGFLQSADGGQLTVAFDHPVLNLAGNDLQLYEITSGDNYPDETARVEVSLDNSVWNPVGSITRDGSVDLGSNTKANYIRITGTGDINLFQTDADNYDIDGVKDLHLTPEICSIANTATISWEVGQVLASAKASTVTVINQDACDSQNANISGMKFGDINGNGIKDEGETGLSGWRIYIDANDNGVLDNEEVSTLTDNNGNYTFTDLEPDMYIIREVSQAGFSQTYPSSVSMYKHVVFVTGTNITEKDFGNHATEQNGGGGGNGGGGSGADLSVDKKIDLSTVNANDTIVYTIKVSNSGPLTATGVTLTDVLPTSITYVSSIATAGVYDNNTGIWSIGTMLNGAMETLTINGTVKNTVTPGQSIVNTASVTALESDPNLNNNTSTAITSIPQSGGGGGGGGGGASSSSSSGGGGGGASGDTNGRILGDSTDVPSGSSAPSSSNATPQVLGTSDSLPRTGLPLGVLLVSAAFSVLLARKKVK